MRPRKILLVENPISGGDAKDDLRKEIEDALEREGIEGEFFTTTGKNDARELSALTARYSPQMLVAIGGDGTVHLVAQVLEDFPQIPIAIIPSGSGNGLSKDLGIPQTQKEAIALIYQNTIKQIDTIRVNEKLCIHLADLGFNALVVKRFGEAETRGPGTYAKIALQEYLGYEARPYSITTDTESFEGSAFMVTITNARNFGSNATINPNAVMDDGAFEVCILEEFPKAIGPVLLLRMYTETIDSSVYSKIISCRNAEIVCRQKEPLQVDGEVMPEAEKVIIKIQPKGLKVALPLGPEEKP